MKRKVVTVVVMLLLVGGIALAYVFGGSNLGPLGYPNCSCMKPYKPFQFNSQWELDRFRDEVENYIDCVNEYLDNADNDIDRIIDAKSRARDEAVLFLDSL